MYLVFVLTQVTDVASSRNILKIFMQKYFGGFLLENTEANTVAFLPTAGIFRILEGAYLAENNWSGREDLNLRPPGPEPGALPG
jgi:hypothetical protein